MRDIILLDDYPLIVDPNSLFNDCYWQMEGAPNVNSNNKWKESYTALCLKQKDFKKFVRLTDYDVDWDVCFSEERYPHKYPCLVQLWTHFEGSMIYTAIEYNIPSELQKHLKEKVKWYPKENELCLFKMKDDNKWHVDRFEAGDIYNENSIIKSVGLNPNGSPYWDYIKKIKGTETELIDDVLRNYNRYKWEIHGFGMLRTYINENTRLQIWHNDYTVEQVTDIHTHPWDFTSTIMQGYVRNITYEEHELNDTDIDDIYDRCLILTGEHAYVKEKTRVRLVKKTQFMHTKGDTYKHKKDIPHRISFCDGTITVLTKENVNPDSLAYSYVEDTLEWVSAAPRLATVDEIQEFIKIASERYLYSKVIKNENKII